MKSFASEQDVIDSRLGSEWIIYETYSKLISRLSKFSVQSMKFHQLNTDKIINSDRVAFSIVHFLIVPNETMIESIVLIFRF